MQFKTSRYFEDILTYIYQSYIQLEIACYRPEIEDLHFLCTSYVMEILQKQLEDARKRNMHEEVTLARLELNKFIVFLISQKDGYSSQHIREELLQLQKNQTNEQYIEKYIQLYRYWFIPTSSKSYEKIFYIKEYLASTYGTIFQEFKHKVKLCNQGAAQPTLHRNGTFTGLFNYNSQRHQDPKFEIDKDKQRDIDMLTDIRTKNEMYFNTFIDEGWLKILSQISHKPNGNFEGPLTAQDISDIREIINSKQLPYQIAKEGRVAIQKLIDLQLKHNPRPIEIEETNNITYWNMTRFKLQHDQQLIECILNPQNSLIGCKVSDLSNQISYLQISKFGNVIAAGCFDGNILICELQEHFLGQSDSKLEFHQKKFSSGAKFISNANFELHIHEGPITAISLLYDELYMLSVSVELTIKLSCLRSRQPLLTFKGHLKTIWHISFAPAGYWFATASEDGTALLWATDHIQCRRIFGPVSPVKIVEFTPSAEQVITVEENRAIRLWSIDRGECVYFYFTDAQVTCLNISFTGQLLALGLTDGQIQLFYLPTMKKLKDKIYLQRIDIHSANSRDYIRSVSLSYDEQTLICCNSNRIGYFSINSLMKETTEDVFNGLYTSKQLIEYQKINCFRNAPPMEILELQDQIISTQFMPQGFAICIIK